METDLYAVLDTNYLRELLNTGREREREVTNEEELNVFNLILLIPPFLRYGLISKLLLHRKHRFSSNYRSSVSEGLLTYLDG